MANSYIGLIPLFLVVLSPFLLKKNFNLKLFFAVSAILILYSMGTNLVVFKIFYNYLPGFDLFRFPNFIRVFFIPSLLIIAGFTLDEIIKAKNYKPLVIISFVFAIIFILIAVTTFIISDISFNTGGLYDLLKNIGFSQRIFIQSILQSVLLILFILGIKYLKLSKKTIIAVFLTADMILSFQMNYVYTGYALRTTVSDTDKAIKKHSNNITLENNKTIWRNTHNKKYYLFDFGFYQYEGKIRTYGNGSFKTNLFDSLMRASLVSKPILSNPVVYITNKIKPLTAAAVTDTNIVYLNKDVYKKFSYELQNRKPAEIENVVFKPNKVTVSVKGSGMLAFLQNYYPGWKVFVNGEKQDLLKANLSFMGVFVPGNENTESRVVFVYERNDVKTAFYISVISFISVFLIFLWTMFYKRKPA